jgi:hypothetical protein
MTRNLEPGLEPQAHVRVRMYRYSGATGPLQRRVIINKGVRPEPVLEVRVEEYRVHLQREGAIEQGEMIVIGLHGNALAIVTAIPEVLERACQRSRKTFKRGDVTLMVDILERVLVEGNAMDVEAGGTVDFIRNRKLSNKTVLLSSVILPILVEGQSRNRTVNCLVLDPSKRLDGRDVIRLQVNDIEILRERENELFPSYID